MVIAGFQTVRLLLSRPATAVFLACLPGANSSFGAGDHIPVCDIKPAKIVQDSEKMGDR